jgi:hypothetical protein
VTGQNEEAALAEELVLAAGHDLGAGLTGLVGLVVVFFVPLEPRGDRALSQHDIQGLFHVVGVEFLVEVDDVVLLVLLDRLGRLDDDARNDGDDVDDRLVDVVDEVVVDHVVVVEQILFQDVLIEVVLVERGLVLEVFVTHTGCLFARGERRAGV